MDISMIRQLVASVYPGEKWRQKVERMTDNQVMAVYYRFRKAGKLP